MLINPNPESALNEEAGKLLLDNYNEFFQRAKLMTEIHAKKDTDSKENVPLEPHLQAEKKKSTGKKKIKNKSLKRL